MKEKTKKNQKGIQNPHWLLRGFCETDFPLRY